MDHLGHISFPKDLGEKTTTWSAEHIGTSDIQLKSYRISIEFYHLEILSGNLTLLWKITIYSGFTHWKWWFSIVMLVYQRVNQHFPMVFLWFSYGNPPLVFFSPNVGVQSPSETYGPVGGVGAGRTDGTWRWRWGCILRSKRAQHPICFSCYISKRIYIITYIYNYIYIYVYIYVIYIYVIYICYIYICYIYMLYICYIYDDIYIYMIYIYHIYICHIYIYIYCM